MFVRPRRLTEDDYVRKTNSNVTYVADVVLFLFVTSERSNKLNYTYF